MSDEEMRRAAEDRKRIAILTDWIEHGLTFGEVRSLLSKAWYEYKLTHTIPHGPRVNIIHHSADGEVTGREMHMREKSIDIPFEDLSPRAQRLYLEALDNMERAKKKSHE